MAEQSVGALSLDENRAANGIINGSVEQRKPDGAALPPAASPNGGATAAEDPEKKAKKDAKTAVKAAKAAKAAAKAAAAEAASKAKAALGKDANSKKDKAKAEADAKKAEEAAEMESVIAAARATPRGAKKDTSAAMPRSYSPPAVEAAWYEWWEGCGFFKPRDDDDAAPRFVIVIPPPNVTGSLHIGHALTTAIQDCIVRWRRMSGYNCLWVPGTDHAGIATQTVVEKKIMRERKQTRHDVGREAFMEEVYSWVEQYGGNICRQLRRMGSSVDWSRQVFTMDQARNAAVKEAFLQLHKAGLIYRDNRLVNWDCTLKTAVSDIEVEYVELDGRTQLRVPGYADTVEFGAISSFAYPLEGGEGEIVVATTRIETMLGDTAVAVHPDDPRYAHLHGKHVVHPVDSRRLPIILDAELVDMSFGTGAVKITPAHDPNDFATGKRHNLEFINILDDDGNINEHGGPFAGRPRFEVRRTITEFLEGKGLFRGIADNKMSLGLCSRSNDVIEPLMRPQWWVNCKQMAASACAAVQNGDLRILPADCEATWFRWLEDIRDWCVSRQLWWGHRIPAFYAVLHGEAGAPGGLDERLDRWLVAPDKEAATQLARERFAGQSFTLQQDEDVLDTWFSSGLFPFSVLGWPQQTEDLARYFPGALLETGRDILFFWVARMVMMGLQLTGTVPFRTVYLHSMVRDAHGRKMSKTLGNVVDPIDVIEGITLERLHKQLEGGNLDPREAEKARAGQRADFPDGIEECGTDALRFALISYTTQGRDINLDIKKVVAYRHWCNKLWNAIKFAMKNLGDNFTPSAAVSVPQLPLACRWLLSRLSATTAAVNAAMEAYEFGSATQAAYAFWQYDLCDTFIEVSKPWFAATEGSAEAPPEQQAARETLWLSLDSGLRLLHPFMPFVTEELWQRLPRRADQAGLQSIMLAPFPTEEPAWRDAQAEASMAAAQKVVASLRSVRNDYGLTVRQRAAVMLACSNSALAASLADMAPEIATLSSSSSVTVLKDGEAAPTGCGVAVVDDTTTAHLDLRGVLDAGKEVQKLQKKRAEVESRREKVVARMSPASYRDKTPDPVKAEDAEKLAKLDAELAAVMQNLQDFQAQLQ